MKSIFRDIKYCISVYIWKPLSEVS